MRLRGRTTIDVVRVELEGLGADVVELELDQRRRELPIELRREADRPTTAIAEVRCREAEAEYRFGQLELEALVEVEVWAESPNVRDRVVDRLVPLLA